MNKSQRLTGVMLLASLMSVLAHAGLLLLVANYNITVPVDVTPAPIEVSLISAPTGEGQGTGPERASKPATLAKSWHTSAVVHAKVTSAAPDRLLTSSSPVGRDLETNAEVQTNEADTHTSKNSESAPGEEPDKNVSDVTKDETHLAQNDAHSTINTPAPPMRSTVNLPDHLNLVFDVFFGEQGQAVARQIHTLAIDQDHYVLSTRGEAVGLMSIFYSGLLIQNSEGLISAEGFIPTRYSEQRGNRPETWVRMDPQNQDIQFDNSDKKDPYPPGLQDRLTFMYQLAAQARAYTGQHGRLTPGLIFDMPVASTREVETNRFRVLGQETLHMGAHAQPTWHFEKVLQQTANPGQESQIEIWFDPNRQWLPVQIKLTDKKGQSFLQRLHPAQGS